VDLCHVWFNLKDGVSDTVFTFYRDFRDPVRERGDEKF
jgi:hypothetical protein